LPASTTTESFTLPSSLHGQEEDTRIQLKSSYSYYTVWFVIAVLLIVVMFSNIFMDKKEGGEGEESGEGGEDSSSVMSSTTLLIGVLIMIVFIYFVVQYILSYFKISRPDLPFDSINPLM
jgi:preprotein translocase subunit SecG